MAALRIVVKAGPHRRRRCPIGCSLGDAAVRSAATVLWDEADARAVPHQLVPRPGGGIELFFVLDELAEGEERSYLLRPADGPSSPLAAGVLLTDRGGRLDIDVGAARFASYNYGPGVVRPYLYPVTPAPGVGVTRDWPMATGPQGETGDHPHHKGIWTAQGEVNGVDNWSEAEGHGLQVHTGFASVDSGAVCGGFVETLEWTDHGRRVLMAETREAVFWDMPAGLRLFDYTVRLEAGRGAVTLGDTKEAGLLSIRVASSMDAARAGGGRILNGSGAVGEAETWGKPAPWCDYAGPVGGGIWGVCFMDHPSNPRHPTTWHVRDYGLMTANCFGLHHFTGDAGSRAGLVIPRGESRSWRYRVLVHAGAGSFEGIAARYQDFAHPPAAAVSG